ncbi:hypothetical protein J7T55_002298 [Diaporthe amygdali]|uniref:uncharacterized protein n=1 Tax=Phomopsis amygdali TaxID=1214568 RepID=UPI0022FEEC9F|nr:uncharacterized protein J7T55_002298 [Diaporthe amygdali]KAJ0109106.1 hypothetical protein J7T55_002298 [Diaporthe amygdali]
MKTVSVLLLAGTAIATRTGPLQPRQSSSSSSTPEVTVKGNAFWAGDERFYIRGVAYQPGGAADAADPLIDITSLTRDVENFKELGINTIRVYTVDNSENHDEGMKILADAGIYLALDVNSPKFSLNRADPFLSYNEKYLQSVFATVDAFANYTNTLLFFSGNEVINDKKTTGTAPYIRAVTRDIKNYINARGYRTIPTGYSSADVSENIVEQLEYFDCGDDSSRADFFAFNDYSWCDPSDFVKSGWKAKVEKYTGYGIPMFLSEYGCIEDERAWGEVAALYSTNMTTVFSGGIAYEYSVEPNGYGIVEIKNGEITPNEDFEELATAFKNTPNPSGGGEYNSDTTASECPAQSENWEVADELIPAPPSGIEEYMDNGAGTGPGLSQDVTTSHYGGDTYSESNITMDGVVVASTSNGSSSSSGSSGSGSGSSSQSGAIGSAAPGLVLSMVSCVCLGLIVFL